MRTSLQSRLIATFVLLALSAQAATSAPLSATNEGSRHATIPSRVTSKGIHLSHDLRHQDLSHDLSSSPPSNHDAGEQLYIKLTAFEKTLYLNLSASSEFRPGGVVVEVVRGDGSVETRMPSQSSCQYVGHIHHRVLSQQGEGGLGGVMEGSWAAVTTCNGLHGVISTTEGQLFIEPSHLSDGTPHNSRHTHTITKSGSAHHPPPPPPPPPPHLPTKCTAKEAQEESHTSASSARRRRRLVTADTETYVETVVVADQSMLLHHQLQDDLEAYVFTLMNIVSHLYRDASIGHRIKVALLRVVILEREQNFSKVGLNERLLDQFCEWMGSYEEASDWHHDIAVLLTRQVICDGGSNCNALGVANIASACKAGHSCSISRDSGLSTAFTIAHEMGHNLGMKHDGGGGLQGCDAGEQFIMAPSFAESANPHIWSECSKHQLADFLSSPKSSCLINRPPETAELFSDSLLLPGMEYTPTEQCRLHLGSSAYYCSGKQNECASMWCRAGNNSVCRNLVIPLTPGTECALSADEKGVCHQGECVAYQEVASPIEGGWGKWEEWTNCSLPCGTGIQHRDRTCNSPIPRYGGHYCLGEKRSYRTCSLHACEQGEGDVRQRYCETNPPSTTYTSWETISLDRISHLGLDMCRSHCIPVDAGHSVIHSSAHTSLPNGTPCLTSHSHSQGVCLFGKCKPISCMGELGVESKRDECGVWCGGGDSCLSVAGSFSEVDTPETYKYYQAVIIPSGSTHISVNETTPSLFNYIALEGLRTGDSLNRGFQVMSTRQRVLAGSLWAYQRLANGAESLHSDGPIDEDVAVYILAYYEYDGIDFTFNPPKAELGRLGATVYSWNSTEWRACDAECGSGLQQKGVACWEVSLGGGVKEVDDKCDFLQRPMSERECVVEPCRYQWVELEWDTCSVSCGGGGVQMRGLACVWVRGEGNVEVESDLCYNEATPTTAQPCQQESCPPEYRWHHGVWGACDVVCGEGWMERGVWCEGEHGTVHNESCQRDDKPPYKVTCHAPEVCSNFQWTLSDWSECEGSCGEEGQQVRTVTCQHRNGTQVEAQFCSQRSFLPAAERICTPECPTTPTPTTATPTPCAGDLWSRSFCDTVRKYNACRYESFRTLCCASCSITLT